MSTATRVYVHPGCTVRHRSWNTHAACRYPGNVWVSGEGPVAIVRWCDDRLRVSLHADVETAQGARDWIDRTACGHACVKDHEVVDLRREGDR